MKITIAQCIDNSATALAVAQERAVNGQIGDSNALLNISAHWMGLANTISAARQDPGALPQPEAAQPDAAAAQAAAEATYDQNVQVPE